MKTKQEIEEKILELEERADSLDFYGSERIQYWEIQQKITILKWVLGL